MDENTRELLSDLIQRIRPIIAEKYARKKRSTRDRQDDLFNIACLYRDIAAVEKYLIK